MGYRIKTVAKLTGVPRNTLLAWERRYDLVSPSRMENGYREYSDSDIASLLSVKRLLDQGYKVSEAIQLIQGARELAQGPTPVPGSVRIALLHPTLLEQLEATADAELPLNVVYSAQSAAELLDLASQPEAGANEDVDVLLADLSALGGDPLTTLRACQGAVGAQQLIVSYQFATDATLQRLVSAGARLVSGTARAMVVRQAIREQVALYRTLRPTHPSRLVQGDDEGAEAEVKAEEGARRGRVPPPRMFSDTQLARLREIRSSVECECPNHVASLVMALLAFEQYSRDCQSQSVDDARLHAHLMAETGHARAIMEGLLREICAQDRISL